MTWNVHYSILIRKTKSLRSNMSAVAKKRPTKVKIIIGDKPAKHYRVPKNKARGVEQLLLEFLVEDKKPIPSNEVFKSLDKKYSKTGNILCGLRLRDKLTQTQLAKKIGTSQANIAAIENGRRNVGKTLAHKFAKVFKTNYRVFLGNGS